MNYVAVAIELKRNRGVFLNLLSGMRPEEYNWKVKDTDWSILEILCHLYDEEREDFRGRLQHVLEHPDRDMKPIDPEGWVKEKKYAAQDFNKVLAGFLNERDLSLQWLETLRAPAWENVHIHPKIGAMSAKMIFSNWLAHDYLHLKQILWMKYAYLQEVSKDELNYAGSWEKSPKTN